MQPKLRFKGFTDDWEKRRLGDVVNKVRSYSLSRDVECNKSTGYKYIHYGDIHTGVADIINKKSVLPNIKPNQYDTLSVNDLIVADASEDYQGIASPAVIQALPDENLVAGLHTIALRPQDTNATFLYYLLHTGNFKHFGYRAGTGLKVFGISWPNLSKFEFNLPSQKEQDKVVDLLRLLDNLVVVNQRKVDLLKRKKAGYLQKLFPKNGQNNPELRFKGYTDAWEKRKLENFTKSYSGGTPSISRSDYYGGEIPFIRSAEINSDSTDLYLTEIGLKNSSAKMVQYGDILYALYGATSGEVGIARIHGAINQAILAIKPTDGDDSQFIMQWLRKQKGHIINTYLQGGQGNLSGSIVKSLEVRTPVNKNEEFKIGSLLKKIDNLITVNQDK